MSDITLFLAARFDEEYADAVAAQEADPAPWRANTTNRGSTERRSGHGSGLVIAGDDTALWDCEGSNLLCMTAPTARHVARWDPAHVLREVKAKRELLEWCAKVSSSDWSAYNDDRSLPDQIQDLATNAAIDMALRAMAAPHAGHPDFNPKWAMR